MPATGKGPLALTSLAYYQMLFLEKQSSILLFSHILGLLPLKATRKSKKPNKSNDLSWVRDYWLTARPGSRSCCRHTSRLPIWPAVWGIHFSDNCYAVRVLLSTFSCVGISPSRKIGNKKNGLYHGRKQIFQSWLRAEHSETNTFTKRLSDRRDQ